MFLSLFLLTLISATGFLLYSKKSLGTNILTPLIGFGAGSMIAVSLIHILPEVLEHDSRTIYAFLMGFALIYIVEEILTPHKHDHAHDDHIHEDPHEHYDHVAWVSWIAICIHTLLDGVNIRAGIGLSDTIGLAILIGVGLHQIPVSLSLAAILQESRIRRHTQRWLLLAFMFAVPIGYILSDLILSGESSTIAAFASAGAGGSLLYVATADLLPMIHSQGKRKYTIALAFLAGMLIMSLLKWFE